MRRKHRIGYLAGAVAVLICIALSCFAQENVKTVDDGAFKERLRAAVPFSHDEHNEKAKIEECQTCHHVYKDGKKVESASSEDQQCSECHMAGGKDSMTLVKVYHARCKSCHEEKKMGPITCAECHPNK